MLPRLIAICLASGIGASAAHGQQPLNVQPGTVVRFTTDSLAYGSSPYYRTAVLVRLAPDSIFVQHRADTEAIPLRTVGALYVQRGFEPRSTKAPIFVALASGAALITYVAASVNGSPGPPTGIILTSAAIGLGTGLFVSHLWPLSPHWVAAWPPGIAGTALPN